MRAVASERALCSEAAAQPLEQADAPIHIVGSVPDGSVTMAQLCGGSYGAPSQLALGAHTSRRAAPPPILLCTVRISLTASLASEDAVAAMARPLDAYRRISVKSCPGPATWLVPFVAVQGQ